MAASLHPIRSPGEASRYVAHGAAEYADKDGNVKALSAWVGRGAEMLQLAGQVDPEQLTRLLLGEDPRDPQKVLVKRQPTTTTAKGKKRETRFGWELELAPPKSVSIVAFRDPGVVDDIWQSSLAVAKEIDRRANVTDQTGGKKGRQGLRKSDGLALGNFLHMSARPTEVDAVADPHVHTHLLIPSLARCDARNDWRAIQAESLFADQKEFDALFLENLKERLVARGYELRKTEHNFEIVGVSQTLLDHFSGRSRLKKDELEVRRIEALAGETEKRREGTLAYRLSANGWDLEPMEVSRVVVTTNAEGKPVVLKDGRTKTRMQTFRGWALKLPSGGRLLDITGSGAEIAKLSPADRSALAELRQSIWADPQYVCARLSKGEWARIKNRTFEAKRVDKSDGREMSFEDRLAALPRADRESLEATLQRAKETREHQARDPQTGNGTSEVPERLAKEKKAEPQRTKLEQTPGLRRPPQEVQKQPSAQQGEQEAIDVNLVIDQTPRHAHRIDGITTEKSRLKKAINSVIVDVFQTGEFTKPVSSWVSLIRQRIKPKPETMLVEDTLANDSRFLKTEIQDGNERRRVATLISSREDVQRLLFEDKEEVVESAEMNDADKRRLKEAIDFVLADVFEKNSTMRLSSLVLAVRKRMEFPPLKKHIEAALKRDSRLLIHPDSRDPEQHLVATHRETVLLERQMVAKMEKAKGRYKPVGVPDAIYVQRQLRGLNAEQRIAVEGIANSRDGVMALRGFAGTGKTTVLKSVAAIYEERGLKVITCAPSADASRSRLREEGFADADTLAAVLASAAPRKAFARKGKFEFTEQTVIILDEAGLAGIADVDRLLAAAAKAKARVLLAGDEGQKAPVAPGDAFRLLNDRGMEKFALVEIRRQAQADDPRYSEVTKALVRSKLGEGIKLLKEMGAVRQFRPAWATAKEGKKEQRAKADHRRYTAAAQDYIKTIASGRDVIAVSPTHREGDAFTKCVQDEKRREGTLDTFSGVDVERLRALDPSVAVKSDANHYTVGQVIVFNTDADRWKARTKWRVTRIKDGEVLVREIDAKPEKTVDRVFDKNPSRWGAREHDKIAALCEEEMAKTRSRALPKEKVLPLKAAESFTIHEADTITLGVGERIRWRGPTTPVDGKEIDNGTINTVVAIDQAKRELRLNDNSVVRLGEVAHVDFGYIGTEYKVQGKDDDVVLVVMDAQSARDASSIEGFSVAISRGTKAVRLYVDSITGVVEGVSQTAHRLTGMELEDMEIGRRNSQQLARESRQTSEKAQILAHGIHQAPEKARILTSELSLSR